MTIAAGFVCSDGLVLCADTQYTSSTKFSETKLWEHSAGDLRLVIAAAGDATLMNIAVEGVTKQLDAGANLEGVKVAMGNHS